MTNLGQGVVLDIELDRKSGYPSAVRVRFEQGSRRGVWYSVATLTRVRDIFGAPIPAAEQ